jgi:hypothetical protein
MSISLVSLYTRFRCFRSPRFRSVDAMLPGLGWLSRPGSRGAPSLELSRFQLSFSPPSHHLHIPALPPPVLLSFLPSQRCPPVRPLVNHCCVVPECSCSLRRWQPPKPTAMRLRSSCPKESTRPSTPFSSLDRRILIFRRSRSMPFASPRLEVSPTLSPRRSIHL